MWSSRIGTGRAIICTSIRSRPCHCAGERKTAYHVIVRRLKFKIVSLGPLDQESFCAESRGRMKPSIKNSKRLLGTDAGLIHSADKPLSALAENHHRWWKQATETWRILRLREAFDSA